MRALFLKVFNDFLKDAAFSGTVDARQSYVVYFIIGAF